MSVADLLDPWRRHPPAQPAAAQHPPAPPSAPRRFASQSQKNQLRAQLDVASKARESARASMKELRGSMKFTKGGCKRLVWAVGVAAGTRAAPRGRVAGGSAGAQRAVAGVAAQVVESMMRRLA